MTAKWGTAVWDADRWPSVAVADLVIQKPAATGGARIGAGDWLLKVEILFPTSTLSASSGSLLTEAGGALLTEAGDALLTEAASGTPSLWAVAEWGSSDWGLLEWVDVTDDVRGLSIKRGADEPHGRPRVGTLSLDLNSHDDRWSPLNPSPPVGTAAYFAPGTLIRVGCVSPGDIRAGGWLPLITVEVDSWVQRFDQGGKDRIAEVQGFELTRFLSGIDENALASSVGGSESARDRFDRILDESNWPYGVVYASSSGTFPSTTLQATDLSANRLSECYLTADSSFTVFRADVTGRAFVSPSYEFPTVDLLFTDWDVDAWRLLDFSLEAAGGGNDYPTVGFATESVSLSDVVFVDYEPDTLDVTNDDYHIVNEGRISRAGGSEQNIIEPASVARFGKRTFSRSDLICETDAVAKAITERYVTTRANNTLRVQSVTVDNNKSGDAEQFLTTIAADVDNFAYFYFPDQSTTYLWASIGSVRHDIAPFGPGGLRWKTTFSLDTREVSGIPGAQLPADRVFIPGL